MLPSIDATIRLRMRPARLGSFRDFYVLERWYDARGGGKGVVVGWWRARRKDPDVV